MESERKKTEKDQPSSSASPSPPCKPLLVRKLTTLEDVRRVQARLVKEYLAGRITTEVAKTGAYLTATLTATLKELKPGMESPVITELHIVPHSDAESAFIAEMNTNIMPPPENNE